ncbi:MAG: hypothetical protein AUI10_08405 [Actinobacteria bacterium 13_2_20CM_2_72_6]|nr:MAG: hypothetical protein AUI10_08405 [Actinobacteria bacterium 13_2_20CM_2_72_6]
MLADPVWAEPDIPDDAPVLDGDELLGGGGQAHPLPVPLDAAGGLHGVEHVVRHDAGVCLLPAVDVDADDVLRIVERRAAYGQHAASVTVGGTG